MLHEQSCKGTTVLLNNAHDAVRPWQRVEAEGKGEAD